MLPSDIFTSVRPDEAAELQRLATDKNVLEIGSWTGYSAIAMAETAKSVHAVDWHMGDEHAGFNETLPEMWTNVRRYGFRERIVIHVGRSADVLPFLATHHFDMIFIDGYHTRDAVLEDIRLANRVLKEDAIWAFHDYGDERFEVTAAVDEVFGGVDRLISTLAIIEP